LWNREKKKKKSQVDMDGADGDDGWQVEMLYYRVTYAVLKAPFPLVLKAQY
jgi:hypothetical protein